MVLFLFWVCFSLIVYTYLLYPCILYFWVIVRKVLGRRNSFATSVPNDPELPTVTIVVSAYNEEAVVQEKKENLIMLDYPRDKLEVVFGSDGSTDRTNTILRQGLPPRIRFIEFQQRRGKAAVLNDLIPQATGDIVVLSDANTLYKSDTIRKLVRHFDDPRVGAVCGELVLTMDVKTAGGLGEGSYWRYENRIKLMESSIRTTVGATGAVYAIRKKLFVPLPMGKVITDDFVMSLGILKQGFTMSYDPQAIAYEQSANTVAAEFRRKVRIGAANFHGISELSPLLHPRYGFVAFILWSRKITRWVVPFLLIGLIMSSFILAMQSSMFFVITVIEIIFSVLTVIGLVCEKMNLNIGPFGLPYYFTAMNAALVVGFLKSLFGLQKPTWEVDRIH